MTTPSLFSSNGLTIAIFEPLFKSVEPIGNYSTEVSSYTHHISAVGGFTSAELTINGNNIFAESWLQYGLGRHVVVYNPSLNIIWEGYVNQVDIKMGGINFTRGPLDILANRVFAMYTPIIGYDAGTGEPITGTPTETIIVQDEFSQSRYGIWEKILNIGEAERTHAEYMRDVYLAENASPEGFPSFALGGEEIDISVAIHCKGYYEWLNYIYNYVAVPPVTSTTADDKIMDVITADPNGIFDTVFDKVKYNGVLVNTFEDENRHAKVIINEIVDLGGGNDDRWTFGFYANRKAVYATIPTDVEYLYHKTGRTQEIEHVDGYIVKPWDVLPCKWVAIPDFLAGSKIHTPHNDPRIFFAEEVSFTAPDQLSISGAKVRNLPQFMAKLGLGGI